MKVVVDIEPGQTVLVKSRNGKHIKLVPQRAQECRECAFYSLSLELCGRTGDVVHMEPDNVCLKGVPRG